MTVTIRTEITANKPKTVNHKRTTKIRLAIDKNALKRLRLVAVAYSDVAREFFPTEEAYVAEAEVEQRAQKVIEVLRMLGIPVKGYAANQYFLPSLLVDKPDLVLNLVDTLKGNDLLQTSIPAALELANIPYTGGGMQSLVIGNDRHLTKQLMVASSIPTPEFQFIRRAGTKIKKDLGLPLIVKLNESGGSVGIDDHALKETIFIDSNPNTALGPPETSPLGEIFALYGVEFQELLASLMSKYAKKIRATE